MLPPSADIVRMRIVEKPESWARERASVARMSARAAAAAAVASVITTKPARCEKSGRPNARLPQRNITVSCAKPTATRNTHLPKQDSRHAEPRAQEALERARLHLLEQHAACRSDHREEQEHHADAGGVERNQRPALLVAGAHDVDDLDVRAHRRTARAAGRARPLTGLQPWNPRVHRGPLLRRERARVGLELPHAALHHQVWRRRHRDLLQQPPDHVGRNRIGRIGEQRDREDRRRSRIDRRPRPARGE